MGKKNSDEEHKEGPHGPDCRCHEDPDFEKAAEGMTMVLAELLPNLMSAWAAGAPGVSVDFRFDRSDEELEGIALRAKILEEIDWPEVPDLKTMVENAGEEDIDHVEGFLRWRAKHPLDSPPYPSNGKGVVH